MPLIVPVDDPADPRIAAYRDIRERDLVGRGERFIAEGKVVVRVLLESSPYRVESLLIAAPRLTGVEPLLSILPDDVPVYAASQPVLDAIAGFPVHRGVLAVGRRGPAPDAANVDRPGWRIGSRAEGDCIDAHGEIRTRSTAQFRKNLDRATDAHEDMVEVLKRLAEERW